MAKKETKPTETTFTNSLFLSTIIFCFLKAVPSVHFQKGESSRSEIFHYV